MRQRLTIAGALLGDPEVLILDEPANGLDPEGIRWLRGFLRGLAEQGRTVLVSSHVLSEMAQLADRVVIIHRGRLISHTSLGEILARAEGGVRVRSPQAEQFRTALSSAGIESAETSPGTLAIKDAPIERVGELAAHNRIVLHELEPGVGVARGDLPRADGRREVIELIRAELLKLRTTRMVYSLLGALLLIVAIATVAVIIDQSASELAGEEDQSGFFGTAATGIIFVLLLGVMIMSGEFRHGTITQTFLITPNRWKVLACEARRRGGCSASSFGGGAELFALDPGGAAAGDEGRRLRLRGRGDLTRDRHDPRDDHLRDARGRARLGDPQPGRCDHRRLRGSPDRRDRSSPARRRAAGRRSRSTCPDMRSPESSTTTRTALLAGGSAAVLRAYVLVLAAPAAASSSHVT